VLSAIFACLVVFAAWWAWDINQPLALWAPLALLAALCVAAITLNSTRFCRLLSQLAKPRVAWVLLLLVSPLLAWYFVWRLTAAQAVFEIPLSPILDRSEVATLRLMTDRGREVPVYDTEIPETAERVEQAWIAEANLACRVIRTGEIDATCNCHGWVFTGGQYALSPEGVEMILADNGYELVTTPQAGDIVIYRTLSGEILHTGLVRTVLAQDMVLVESKWGPLGRFLHFPEDQPYSASYTFYRSPRHGHLLPLVHVAEKPLAME
jgi:hypothetical protein